MLSLSRAQVQFLAGGTKIMRFSGGKKKGLCSPVKITVFPNRRKIDNNTINSSLSERLEIITENRKEQT